MGHVLAVLGVIEYDPGGGAPLGMTLKDRPGTRHGTRSVREAQLDRDRANVDAVRAVDVERTVGADARSWELAVATPDRQIARNRSPTDMRPRLSIGRSRVAVPRQYSESRCW